MYLCKNCGKDFDTPGRATDSVGYSYSICPYCESDDFSEAKRCPFSGAYIEAGESYADEVYQGVAKELDELAMSWGVVTDEMNRAFGDMLVKWVEGRE